jgi:hypothetical protein
MDLKTPIEKGTQTVRNSRIGLAAVQCAAACSCSQEVAVFMDIMLTVRSIGRKRAGGAGGWWLAEVFFWCFVNFLQNQSVVNQWLAR